MKTHAVVLSGLTSLLLATAIPGALAQTPAAAPAQAQPGPAGQTDPQGNILAPGALATTAALQHSAKACLQLQYGTPNSAQLIFNFDVTFDPTVTNFPITGGTISGGLCNASQWHVTGGNLGPNLTLTATRPAGGNCSTQLTVAGNAANPSSYTGTYGFPGTGFPQHTLFLGYQKASCP
jgi:hypothetical protein